MIQRNDYIWYSYITLASLDDNAFEVCHFNATNLVANKKKCSLVAGGINLEIINIFLK